MNYVKRRIKSGIDGVIRGFAFYVAILMPCLYILVLWSGFETERMLVILLGLMGINGAALLVGHSYKSPE